MKNETKRICVVDTAYTLLLYYLIFGIKPNDIFIMSGGVPEAIRKNINHIYFPHFRQDDIQKSNFILKLINIIKIIIKRSYGIIKLRILLFFKTNNYDVNVYGQGHLNFSYPLYEYENSYLIEDGLANYLDLKEPKYNLPKILNFFGFYTRNFFEGFGTHKNIKKIYLTENNVPKIVKDKVEVINIEKTWQNLCESEKKEILRIFNINYDKISFKDETVLILTQPLTEEKITTLNEELTIYEEIIKKFNKKDIIIKPHPRDPKKYKEIFPNIKIIDKDFPIELLNLIGIEPEIVCSITSTSALHFKNSKIYIYDGELKNKKLIDARNELIKRVEENNRTIIN